MICIYLLSGRKLEYQYEQKIHFQSETCLLRGYFSLPLTALDDINFLLVAFSVSVALFSLTFRSFTTSTVTYFAGVSVRIAVCQLLRLPRPGHVFMCDTFLKGCNISGFVTTTAGKLGFGLGWIVGPSWPSLTGSSGCIPGCASGWLSACTSDWSSDSYGAGQSMA